MARARQTGDSRPPYEGGACLSLFASEGRFLQLALPTRGEFFGETALVRGWRRVSQAVALQDSRVGRIEAQALVTEVCGLPWETFAGLTETVLKPLFLVSLRRSLFLVEGLPDRVALALWECAGHPEAQRSRGLLPSTLTHEQLAAVVGASRPRVSLALKRLEREGVFVREGKQVRVHERSCVATWNGSTSSCYDERSSPIVPSDIEGFGICIPEAKVPGLIIRPSCRVG